jgi:hypothetical protein
LLALICSQFAGAADHHGDAAQSGWLGGISIRHAGVRALHRAGHPGGAAATADRWNRSSITRPA